jgi:thiamine transporter
MGNTETGKRSQVNREVARMVTSAMMLALAVVLYVIVKYIPGLSWPNGGSIALSMVPLVLCALLCGPVWGTVMGVAFGAIDMLIGGGYAYSWISIVLDYLLAFGLVGIASLFEKPFYQKKVWAMVAALLVYGALRLLCHFLSGCIVFTQTYETGDPIVPDFSWGGITYSLSYNAGYLLPSIALCAFVMVLLAKPLFTLMDTPFFKAMTPKGLSEGKPSKVRLTFLLPFYAATVFALGILSDIPVLKVYWLGYLGAILSLGFFLYCIILGIRSIRTEAVFEEEDPMAFFKSPALLYLIFAQIFLLALGVNTLGIVSYYTYGAITYQGTAE